MGAESSVWTVDCVECVECVEGSTTGGASIVGCEECPVDLRLFRENMGSISEDAIHAPFTVTLIITTVFTRKDTFSLDSFDLS